MKTIVFHNERLVKGFSFKNRKLPNSISGTERHMDNKAKEDKREANRKLLREVIERIKGLKYLDSDEKVADILGMERQQLYNDKFRGSIPWEELVWFAIKEDIGMPWLIKGEGPLEPFSQSKSAERMLKIISNMTEDERKQALFLLKAQKLISSLLADYNFHDGDDDN